MSDDYQPMNNDNGSERPIEESDNGIEIPKTKKGKPRKPYEMTEARKAAFARCRAKKDEYLQAIRDKKQKGEIPKEPVARTLNKYVQLKNKLKSQGVEVEDEPIKVQIKKPVKVVDEYQDDRDEEEQVIIKKKPKAQRKKVVVFQSESEEEEKHYNTEESSEEEVIIRRPKPKQSKPKKEKAPVQPAHIEQRQFTLKFV